jgi:ATP-dependent exoDNAse (exonuclease V) alpha subunit
VAISDPATSESRFTTDSLLASERAIVDGADRRRDARLAVVPADPPGRESRDGRPPLNADQTAAVTALGASGNGVDVVSALAGTGKTTMLAALAGSYRDAGYRVIGTAPTARAARELRDTAGIPAGTMHALIGELDRAGGFDQRTVLVIDEAGMAATRITAAIFVHAEQADTKVIAVGDPGQLAAVQAGGWLGAIARGQPGPQLRQVIRQRDPQERAALEALHDGHPDRYLEHKHDAVTLHDTETEAIVSLVDQWDCARSRDGIASAVMIVRDNQTREQLNFAARDRLKQDGTLPERGVRVAGREYAPGDRIVARHNDRRADVDNGTLATVVNIDARTHRMTIAVGPGQQRDIDLSYVARHVEHAYALTAHSAQGATVQWAGVIGRPGDFSREWAYTALSRARRQTTLHVIAEPPTEARQRSDYAPAEPRPIAAQALVALERRMRHTESELLAIEYTQLRNTLTGSVLPAAFTTPAPLPASPRFTSGRRRTVTR